MIISDITLRGTDLHLPDSSEKRLENNIYCSTEKILNQTADPCGLNKTLRKIPDLSISKSRRSLINIYPFLEDSGKVTVKLENVLIQDFYSINENYDSGWISLIQAADLFNYEIVFTNTTFKNILFPAGILLTTTIDFNFIYYQVVLIIV